MSESPLTFAIPMALLLLIAFGLVAAAVMRMWWALQEPKSAWRQLPGCGIPVYYVPADWINEKRLSRCINLAVDLVRESGPWDAGVLASSLSNARISVEPDGAHPSLHDRGVGLVRPPADLSVDVSLLELAHELIHLIEHRLEHTVDRAHSRWPLRGLARAEENYRRALSSRRDTPPPPGLR